MTDASDIIQHIENIEWNGNVLQNVHCAAHKLQLCVMDTLNQKKSGQMPGSFGVEKAIKNHIYAIDEARVVIKNLRNSSLANLRKKHNLLKPKLDCITRWNSTYKMLHQILLKHYREFCEVYSTVNVELFLSNDTWQCIEEIVLCLMPVAKACIKLQGLNVTLTDIYMIYNTCHTEVSEIGTVFSQEILYNLTKRRKEMFNHNVFFTAQYLDPRYNFDLSDLEQERAIQHILWLHNKVEDMIKELDKTFEEATISLDTESLASSHFLEMDTGECL